MLDPGNMLEPDRDQLEIFIDAIFRHAKQGFVSLRSFYEDENDSFRIVPVPTTATNFHKYLCDVAQDIARRAAGFPKPVVFCPPLATFNNKNQAREIDIVEGLVLSVECDQNPAKARERLEQLLGPATVVVRSGGIWTNGGGEAQDKIHLHWRLRKPAGINIKTDESGKVTVDRTELIKLKYLRDLAARLVGGDPTNKAVCHPIRWPGSWHRKATPRLCEIIAADPDREIDLDAALQVFGVPADKNWTAPEPHIAPDDDLHDERGRLDWSAAFAQIISGASYHPTLTPLAASFAAHGIPEAFAHKLLDAVLVNSHPSDPERERRREAERSKLKETVASGYVKFKVEEPPPHDGDGIPDQDPRPGAYTDYGADEPPDWRKQNEPPPPAPLNEWSAAADIKPPPPREWLLATTFCRRFLSSLLGDGGVGKSALRVAQAMALATGRDLTGEYVHKRTKVLIVSLEDDAEELRRRVLAARIHHGVNADQLADLYLAAPSRGVGKLMQLTPKGRVVEGTFGKVIEDAIIRHEIGLVILDPFVKTHGVPENLNNEMDAVAQLLSDLAAKHNVAIDFPHHVSKGITDPGNANRGRGATATVNAGRLVYTLSTMSTDEAEKFGIPEDERRQYVRLDRAKINIARASGSATWFRLVGVKLSNPTDDYPSGDEVQTVEPWKPTMETALDGPTVRVILDTIERGLDNRKNFYTDRPNAKGREAWKVVKRYAKDKNELSCRGIIKTWLRDGVLTEFSYKNPRTSKDVKGLAVNRTEAAELIEALGGGSATETRTRDDPNDGIRF